MNEQRHPNYRWWYCLPILRTIYRRGYTDGYHWHGVQIERGREMSATSEASK